MKKLTIVLIAFNFIAAFTIAQSSAPRVVINSMGHSAKVQNLNFTPDGQKIISVSEDKTVRVWNTNTGEMLRKFESEIGDGFNGMLYASSLSPDGTLLAIAGYTVTTNNQVYIAIIDINKGVQVGTALGHTSTINSLAFTGNGKFLVSGSDDGSLKVWLVDEKTPNYKEVLSIETGGPIKYLAMNLVTSDVALALEGKKEIQVYSLSILEKGGGKFNPRFWSKHKGDVNKLAYSDDGLFLASSSHNSEFILWRADGKAIKEWEREAPINAISFSHDSKILVALDNTGKGISYGVPEGNKFTDFNGHDNAVLAALFPSFERYLYLNSRPEEKILVNSH